MLPSINSYQNLGGELVDYAPSIDPTTDLPATCDNDTRSDVSAMTRICNRAFVNATVTVVNDHDATWGGGIGVLPTILNGSAGTFAITWPATVQDARGNSWALNFRHAMACCEDAGYSASAIKTGPNTATVFTTKISTQALTNPPGAWNAWTL